MYKRAHKRIERIREEERLGLTEEDKELFGLQGTDSEESASESDESDEGLSEEESDENGDEEDEDEDDMPVEEEGESTDEDSVFDGPPPVPLAQATRSPIYEPPGKRAGIACVICPGKLLKEGPMADAHSTSSAHKRRARRFDAYVEEMSRNGRPLGTDDPRVVVERMDALQAKEAAAKMKHVGVQKKPSEKPIGEKTPNRKARRAAQRAAEAKKTESMSKTDDGHPTDSKGAAAVVAKTPTADEEDKVEKALKKRPTREAEAVLAVKAARVAKGENGKSHDGPKRKKRAGDDESGRPKKRTKPV